MINSSSTFVRPPSPPISILDRPPILSDVRTPSTATPSTTRTTSHDSDQSLSSLLSTPSDSQASHGTPTRSSRAPPSAYSRRHSASPALFFDGAEDSRLEFLNTLRALEEWELVDSKKVPAPEPEAKRKSSSRRKKVVDMMADPLRPTGPPKKQGGFMRRLTQSRRDEEPSTPPVSVSQAPPQIPRLSTFLIDKDQPLLAHVTAGSSTPPRSGSFTNASPRKHPSISSAPQPQLPPGAAPAASSTSPIWQQNSTTTTTQSFAVSSRPDRGDARPLPVPSAMPNGNFNRQANASQAAQQTRGPRPLPNGPPMSPPGAAQRPNGAGAGFNAMPQPFVRSPPAFDQRSPPPPQQQFTQPPPQQVTQQRSPPQFAPRSPPQQFTPSPPLPSTSQFRRQSLPANQRPAPAPALASPPVSPMVDPSWIPHDPRGGFPTQVYSRPPLLDVDGNGQTPQRPQAANMGKPLPAPQWDAARPHQRQQSGPFQQGQVVTKPPMQSPPPQNHPLPSLPNGAMAPSTISPNAPPPGARGYGSAAPAPFSHEGAFSPTSAPSQNRAFSPNGPPNGGPNRAFSPTGPPPPNAARAFSPDQGRPLPGHPQAQQPFSPNGPLPNPPPGSFGPGGPTQRRTSNPQRFMQQPPRPAPLTPSGSANDLQMVQPPARSTSVRRPSGAMMSSRPAASSPAPPVPPHAYGPTASASGTTMQVIASSEKRQSTQSPARPRIAIPVPATHPTSPPPAPQPYTAPVLAAANTATTPVDMKHKQQQQQQQQQQQLHLQREREQQQQRELQHREQQQREQQQREQQQREQQQREQQQREQQQREQQQREQQQREQQQREQQQQREVQQQRELQQQRQQQQQQQAQPIPQPQQLQGNPRQQEKAKPTIDINFGRSPELPALVDPRTSDSSESPRSSRGPVDPYAPSAVQRGPQVYANLGNGRPSTTATGALPPRTKSATAAARRIASSPLASPVFATGASAARGVDTQHARASSGPISHTRGASASRPVETPPPGSKSAGASPTKRPDKRQSVMNRPRPKAKINEKSFSFMMTQPRIVNSLLPYLNINSFLNILGSDEEIRKYISGEMVGRWIMREWGITVDRERGRSWPGLTVWEGFLESLLHDPAVYSTYPNQYFNLLRHLSLSHSLIVLFLRTLPASAFPYAPPLPFEDDLQLPPLHKSSSVGSFGSATGRRSASRANSHGSDNGSTAGIGKMPRRERVSELVMPAPLSAGPDNAPKLPSKGSISSLARSGRRGSIGSLASVGGTSFGFGRKRSNSTTSIAQSAFQAPTSSSVPASPLPQGKAGLPPVSFPAAKRYQFARFGGGGSKDSSGAGPTSSRPGSIMSAQSSALGGGSHLGHGSIARGLSSMSSDHLPVPPPIGGGRRGARSSMGSSSSYRSERGGSSSPVPRRWDSPISGVRNNDVEPAFDRPPPYMTGRAPILRVFVPVSERVPRWPSAEGAAASWRELEKCGASKRMRLGDLVVNTALARPVNTEHVMIFVPFVQHKLVPLEYVHSATGHLPHYLDAFALSPVFYDPFLPTPQIVYLDFAPYAQVAMNSLRLAYDWHEVTTASGSKLSSKRYLHVAGFEIRQGDRVAPEWCGMISLEAEGTAEGKRDMLQRFGYGNGSRAVMGAWEVVPERSMMGSLWLRLIRE